MVPDPAPEKKSIYKNPLFYSSVVVVIIALAVSWTVFSRWESARSFDRREKQEQLERQRKEDQAALEQMGGTDLAIQMFYVSPAVIHRGQSAQLCYGVANAKTISIEPPPGPVWPSYSRCLDITPSKTTTYTLKIDGASGSSQSQSVTLKVQ
jgi:hypothetical protein